MIDEEDRAVWEETVAGIRPLPKTDLPVENKSPKRQPRNKIQTVPLRIYRHEVGLGSASDIDHNTMRRFKRGQFPVEAVLDLHGYNENQAFEAVHQFMTQAYLSGKRCVIIVTGKGQSHADEDIFAPRGVLKNRVPQWLQSDDLRQMILSYIHPSAQMGGEGALYILLRRRRVTKNKNNAEPFNKL